MLHIQLIAVGKLKESYLRDACAEYQKRLSRFCSFQLTELDEARLPERPSEKQIAQGLEAEGAAILSRCRGTVIALCIEGKPLSSEAFSRKLSEIGLSDSAVTLVIGSSHGLSPAVKAQASLRLSMSEMTFPHQLARVMVLEQVYRAFQIQSGGKYHK